MLLEPWVKCSRIHSCFKVEVAMRVGILQLVLQGISKFYSYSPNRQDGWTPQSSRKLRSLLINSSARKSRLRLIQTFPLLGAVALYGGTLIESICKSNEAQRLGLKKLHSAHGEQGNQNFSLTTSLIVRVALLACRRRTSVLEQPARILASDSVLVAGVAPARLNRG